MMKRTLIALCLVFAAAGCAGTASLSPAQRIYLARQTHVEAVRNANNLIESGAVKDQSAKDAIWEAAKQAKDGIEEAEARYAVGDKLGFDYWMRRAAAALDSLARYNARARKSLPVERTEVWTPARSRYSSSALCSHWRSWRTCRAA